MSYIAVFDIGTSSVKGVLLDDQAVFTGSCSVEIETYYGKDGKVEQNPDEWWEGITTITSRWWHEMGINPREIAMITFSGQMEDVIPITDRPQQAILYSDTRAAEEADNINWKMPAFKNILGNTIRASTPAAKLLWIQKHYPELYRNATQFVFSAKDYIIYQLTNETATDMTTAATTGMMNIHHREWARDHITSLGIHPEKLPDLLSAEEVVGVVTEVSAEATGFCEGTPVLCGCGDAGASTMGAGVVNEGDTYLYIGTTGWAATIQGGKQEEQNIEGLFQLAHLPDDVTIAIVPLLNTGNVHHWAVHMLTSNTTGDDHEKYRSFETMLETSPAGANGLLFLPYLNGERCPVNDPDAKGAFWGVGPNMDRNDFARSVIEGISFSLKQLMDLLAGETTGKVTLIGGGTKSRMWCQILADCIGRPLRVFDQSEYMPALGAASTAFIQLGWADDYNDFSQRFIMPSETTCYEPDNERHAQYQQMYQRYLKLYPAMTPIYR